MSWLAASYHFPSTYSIRVPMSSETHARVLPTPGPATIRLTLLRTSIEVFGAEETQHTLFPLFISCSLSIRPPVQVAITQQQLRGYKRSPNREEATETLQESLLQREMAYAKGEMTIYAHIPSAFLTQYATLFRAIGYWGQSSSLTTCLDLSEQEPRSEECMMPLAQLAMLRPQAMIQPWFPALVSEFANNGVTWREVIAPNALSKKRVLHLDVAVWPLTLLRQNGSGKYFLRQAFFERKEFNVISS